MALVQFARKLKCYTYQFGRTKNNYLMNNCIRKAFICIYLMTTYSISLKALNYCFLDDFSKGISKCWTTSAALPSTMVSRQSMSMMLVAISWEPFMRLSQPMQRTISVTSYLKMASWASISLRVAIAHSTATSPECIKKSWIKSWQRT